MSKSRYYIIVIVLLIPLFLGVKYFRGNNFQPETKVSQLPLAIVNYFIPNSQLINTEGINKYKEDNLNMVAAIISENWPTLKKAAVTADINFSYIADYNLTIASSHDDFISQANLNSQSVNGQNYIVALLEDESYQKYVQVVPGRHYNLYLTLEHSQDTQPQAVIINDRSYALTKANAFYLVTDYYSNEATAIGLRPAERGVTIKEAVTTTGQILNRIYDPKRLSADEATAVIINGPRLKINSIDDNRYLLTEVLSDYRITKVGSDQQLGYISYYGFNAVNPDFTRIDSQQSRKLFFLSEQGDYQISDLKRQNQAKRLIEVVIVSLIIIAFLVFYYQIMLYFKKQTNLFLEKVYQPIDFYIKGHLIDLIILTLAVNALVVLRGNPLLSPFLTPTNILLLFIFGLILIARLSLKVVFSLAVAFLFISAILTQSGSTTLQEKTTVYIYLLLVLIIIILLTRTTTRKGRQR